MAAASLFFAPYQIDTEHTAVAGVSTPAVGGLGCAEAPIHYQIIRTRAEFETLEDEWNALFDRAGRGEQMFQSFNWLWHWCNHFISEDDATLAIVVARRAGRAFAILPLCVERVAGLTQLAFMGAPVSQYGDAIAEAGADQAAILARTLDIAIAGVGAQVVRLAKVRDDAMIASILAARGAALIASEEAPFADLAQPGSLASYNERFNAKTLKNRRRQGRRLDELGAVSLSWSLHGADAAVAAEASMALKRTWLKARGQLSRAFADRRVDDFFADVCGGLQRPAGVQVSLLKAGDAIANAAITVTCKDRQAVHVLAYDAAFEKCAPGVLHIERIVEHAFERGVTTLDFLAPRHAYKSEWSDGAMRVADYAVPVTIAGRLYTRVYLGFVREHLKAALKALPRYGAGPIAALQVIVSSFRR